METTFSLTWSTAATTHPGKVRTVNQDAYFQHPHLGLWAVADGMGGHADGDIASRAIVDALQNLPPPPSRLSDWLTQVEECLRQVNADLYDRTLNHSHLVGSTVVVLIALQRHAVVLWAGDSRAYRYRAGQLEQLTQDHSQVEELIEKGFLTPQEAESHSSSHIITRAVGAKEELFLDMDLFNLQEGDIFLLCSDGLSREVTAKEIANLLNQSQKSSSILAHELMKLALRRAAKDNITLIVIQFQAT